MQKRDGGCAIHLPSINVIYICTLYNVHILFIYAVYTVYCYVQYKKVICCFIKIHFYAYNVHLLHIILLILSLVPSTDCPFLFLNHLFIFVICRRWEAYIVSSLISASKCESRSDKRKWYRRRSVSEETLCSRSINSHVSALSSLFTVFGLQTGEILSRFSSYLKS